MEAPDRPNDAELKRLLQQPSPPLELRAALHADLDRAVTAASAPPRSRAWRIAGVLSLALFGAGVWLMWTPADVGAAYADMLRDSALHGVRQGATADWLAANRPALPVGIRLDLAKDCRLNRQPSKHLRLRASDGGTINVFVYHGDNFVWKQRGTIHGHGWIARYPLPGTVVILLYDQPRPPAVVASLLTSLFPSGTPQRI
ncbi:MAG: hypothetical protein ACLGHO_00675 [Gammaproteobacteria bacterium]